MFRKIDLRRATGRCTYTRWLLLMVVAVCGWLALSLSAVPLYAHGGGVPRLTDVVAGPYRIFAWTQPEPLRVGDVHLSIAVVKGERSTINLDEPVTDAAVTVDLQPVTGDQAPLQVSAVLQPQLGNYYYEADAILPTAGDWRFTIKINSALGEANATFVGQVATARQINWTLVIGGGVLLGGLLFLIGVWNRLQSKESTPS